MLNFPVLFSLAALLVLWAAARTGASWRRRRVLKEEERDDFGTVQGAALTLLGLIIGFSFSMAVAAMTCARTTRRRRLTRSVPSMSGRACYRPRMRRRCEPNSRSTSIFASGSTASETWGTDLQSINDDKPPSVRDVVRDLGARFGAAHACDGSGGSRHERCAEFPRVHASGVVEPHSGFGLGLDGPDRNRLQPVGRLRGA